MISSKNTIENDLDKVLKDTQSKMINHIENSKNNSSKLPFIFARMKENILAEDNIDCWVVIISTANLRYPPIIKNEPVNCLVVPENNFEDKLAEKTFPTYQDAWNFVQDWWVTQRYNFTED